MCVYVYVGIFLNASLKNNLSTFDFLWFRLHSKASAPNAF